ncbi:putative nuclease HARBI1 isoform X2 [Maniola jurtina]|uniref:putative nuclease HARBI1 isoform X2 n=2 Tax=Maniola jurtina TaxID=191418 RepID=UPI001E68B3E7|nr:putative nuclease HARBI1 isoform X2 [Maniola jurtina]
MFSRSSSESSSSSDDELIISYLTHRRKRFNIRKDHFLWDDADFLFRYRMPKETVTYLSILLQDKLTSTTVKNKALSVKEQLLLALRFYATGSMQQVVGDIAGVHKSTVCKCVFKVSSAIASLAGMFIQMPTNEELESISCQFYDIARFPKVIGAIDCTHIAIVSPGGETAELYRNRKGVFSYNVQTICDPNLKIRNIVCRWPGGSHDSTIFNNSNVKEIFERGQYGDYVLLGDSGYPAERYLLTPLRNPVTPGEILYNKTHIKTRNTVERSYGVWKRRFPCIGSKLRLKQNRIEAVVVATAVLHNICRTRNDPEPDLPVQIEIRNDESNVPNSIDNRNGQTVISNLIHHYFDRLAAD